MLLNCHCYSDNLCVIFAVPTSSLTNSDMDWQNDEKNLTLLSSENSRSNSFYHDSGVGSSYDDFEVYCNQSSELLPSVAIEERQFSSAILPPTQGNCINVFS